MQFINHVSDMATNCIRFGYEFGIKGCIFMWKIILADYVGTPTRAGARTPPILMIYASDL